MDYKIVYDTTPAVEASIEEIIKTLFEAVILVVIVVFVFLQNVRATFIPLLTVPVSLLGTFIFFPILGFSVNTLTMFGLVLAIGIVVDDAIVVVEAVMHNLEHGMDAKTATAKAMDEVSGPIIGIGLVLTAVFVPVAFLGGLTGRLYQQFALTIAIAVIISVFNALSLSPALAAMLLKPPKPARGPLGMFFRGFNRVFDVSTRGYVGTAGMLARKSILSLGILAVVVFLSSRLAAAVPGGFVPDRGPGHRHGERAAPQRGVARADRRGAAARGEHRRVHAGRGVVQHRRRHGDAHQLVPVQRRLDVPAAQAVGGAHHAGNGDAGHHGPSAARAVQAAGGGDLSRSCRRRFPASARPAASTSCCRIAAAR